MNLSGGERPVTAKRLKNDTYTATEITGPGPSSTNEVLSANADLKTCSWRTVSGSGASKWTDDGSKLIPNITTRPVHVEKSFVNNPGTTTDLSTKIVRYNTSTKELQVSDAGSLTSSDIYITNGTETGSGYTGNTHAVFQRAFNALSSGGTIRVGPGTYTITSPVTLTNKSVTLDFGEATIKFNQAGEGFLLDGIARAVKIIGGIFTRDTGNYPGSSHWFNINCLSCTIEDSYFIISNHTGSPSGYSFTGLSCNEYFDGIESFAARRIYCYNYTTLAATLFNVWNARQINVEDCELAASSYSVDFLHTTQSAVFYAGIKYYITNCDIVNADIKISTSIVPTATDYFILESCFLNAIRYYCSYSTTINNGLYLDIHGCQFNTTQDFLLLMNSNLGTAVTQNVYVKMNDTTFTASSPRVNLGTIAVSNSVYLSMKVYNTNKRIIHTFINNGTLTFDANNCIEWPQERTLSSTLTTADVLTNTVCYTTDKGTMRYNGTVWVQETSQVSSTIYITYGAETGTGFIGNSQVVIQRAIAALSDGGTIVLGPGTYLMGATISLNSKNYTIQGNNSFLSHNFNNYMFNITSTAVLSFENINFIFGASFVNGNYGFLQVGNTAEGHLNYCKLTNPNAVTISALYCFVCSSSTAKIVIENSYMKLDPTTGNVYFLLATENLGNRSMISNCEFVSTQDSNTANTNQPQIRAGGSSINSPFMIDNCRFDRTKLVLDGGTGTLATSVVNNCYITNAWIAIIEATQGNGTTLFVNDTVVNNAGTTSHAIRVDGASGAGPITINTNGCYFIGGSTAEIYTALTGAATMTVRSLNNYSDIRFVAVNTVPTYVNMLIELPDANRTLSALTSAITFPVIGMTAQTNNYGLVRYNGSTWVTDTNLAAIKDVTATAAELNVLDIGTQVAGKVLAINTGGTTCGWKDTHVYAYKEKRTYSATVITFADNSTFYKVALDPDENATSTGIATGTGFFSLDASVLGTYETTYHAVVKGNTVGMRIEFAVDYSTVMPEWRLITTLSDTNERVISFTVRPYQVPTISSFLSVVVKCPNHVGGETLSIYTYTYAIKKLTV